MPDEVKIIGFKEVEKILSALTDDYGMSTECLSNLIELNAKEEAQR
ncbi:hypothetical protein [Desulfosporosinus shakirovi]|nr:hypothetical protein [Desulfosporosinus sp. SRJS8]MCB8817630.1 hypothetical protein [Desulfosporosinus sp. SRJS8]